MGRPSCRDAHETRLFCCHAGTRDSSRRKGSKQTETAGQGSADPARLWPLTPPRHTAGRTSAVTTSAVRVRACVTGRRHIVSCRRALGPWRLGLLRRCAVVGAAKCEERAQLVDLASALCSSRETESRRRGPGQACSPPGPVRRASRSALSKLSLSGG